MEGSALIVFGVTGLLGIVSVLLPIARKIQMPYTFLLALLGVALGFLLSDTVMIEASASDFVAALRSVGLSGDALLNLFLPPLLFAAGLTVNVRRMMDDFAPIVLLAVVGVVFCTAIVGVSIYVSSEMGLLAALLIGAIVSTTDTAAVIAVFRDIGAPQRLSILVEGESLFNDAAAIAIFAILISLLTGASDAPLSYGFVLFFQGLIGGVIVGYLFGRLVCWLIGVLQDATVTEITLTVSLAYLSYLISNEYLNVSGVIACVVAAMVMGTDGRTRVSPNSWEALKTTWRQLDFWATSLIFVLAAMYSPVVLSGAVMSDLWILLVLIAATLAARAFIIFGFMPVLSFFKLSAPVSHSYNMVLWWGGLRGAVTVALALAASETPFLAPETQRVVLVATIGYVLFTLFVKAPTLRPLMKYVDLNALSPRQRLIQSRILQISKTDVHNRLLAIAEETGMQKTFAESTMAEEVAPDAVAIDPEVLSSEEIFNAGLLSLASRESELYLELYGRGILDRRMTDNMRAHAGRLVDGVKSHGLEGYEEVSAKFLKAGRVLKAALWLQRRFGITRPLTDQLADQFEALLISEIALRDLRRVSIGNLEALVGETVARNLDDVLEKRLRAVSGSLRALDVQYSDYANALRTRYFEKLALGFEEAEYRQRFEQSLIDGEIYRTLEEDREKRARLLKKRPSLDLGLQLTQMLKRVPLFQGLSESEIGKIADVLRPYLALPGQAIISQGETGDAMYFIASGDLVVLLEAGTVPLKKGDFFGEMALLNDQPRNASVMSTGYSNLLVLERADFERVLKANSAMASEIQATARARSASNRATTPDAPS